MNKNSLNFYLVAASLAWMISVIPASAQTPVNQARTGRFVMGQGTDPTYQAFVIPLDFQKGVQLSPMTNAPWVEGQPASAYPWFLRVATNVGHMLVNDSGSATYPLDFIHPVAAFGSESTGSPLYIGQSYRFAFHAGGQSPTTDVPDELKIQIYDRAGFSNGTDQVPVLIESLDIPHWKDASATNTNVDWKAFGDSGFQKTFVTSVSGIPVLETTVQLALEKDASGMWGVTYAAPMIITHRALAGAENYYFSVATRGGTLVGGVEHWMAVSDVANPDTTGTHVTGYALNFEQTPPWMTTLVKTPSFQGDPAPPQYFGKTADQITALTTRLEQQYTAPTAGQYTQLNDKPELQSHTILDNFVVQMGSDPIALTNYVQNRIGLVDSLSYNESGDVDEASINAGGMNRGALATFQEGQGSPEEQCALLVYLLRKANVPAAYVKPSHNAVKMRDQDLSDLLRMKISGLQTPNGGQPVPQMIGVNYPWVAAYITENGQPARWVHLFPWLKETEVVEGLGVEGYLPSGKKSIREWVRSYLLSDETSPLWQLDAVDRTPGNIFRKDLDKSLKQNWPGLTADNLGVRFRDRNMNRVRWNDFPQPTEFDTVGGTFTLTDTLSSDGKIYDTVDMEIASVENPTKKITIAGVKTMDLHNRRAVVNFIPTTSGNFNMKFTVQPYDLDNPGTGTGDFNYTTDPYLSNKQEKTVAVNTTDKNFTFKVTYHRDQSYTGAVGTGDAELLGGWSHFLGINNTDFGPDVAATASNTSTASFKLGDLNAFCLNAGHVTENMLRVHLEQFWKHQQARAAVGSSVAPDYDLIQGTTAYLMGMTYYQRVSRSSETLKDLFKVHVVSTRSHGFAQFGPKKDGSGNPVVVSAPLLGSQTTLRIDQLYPALDMNFSRTGWVGAGYGDLRADAGGQGTITGADFMTNLLMAEESALEGHTIRQFDSTKDNDAVSSVNLIQRVQQDANAATNVIELDSNNYLTEKTTNYTFEGTTKTLELWAGTSMWTSVENAFTGWDKDLVRVYITPGPVTGANGLWKGLGTLIIGKSQSGALIGRTNGGAGGPSFLGTSSYSSIAASSWGKFSVSADSSSNAQMDMSAAGYSSVATTTTFSISNINLSTLASYSSSLAVGYSVFAPGDLSFYGATGLSNQALSAQITNSFNDGSILTPYLGQSATATPFYNPGGYRIDTFTCAVSGRSSTLFNSSSYHYKWNNIVDKGYVAGGGYTGAYNLDIANPPGTPPPDAFTATIPGGFLSAPWHIVVNFLLLSPPNSTPDFDIFRYKWVHSYAVGVPGVEQVNVEGTFNALKQPINSVTGEILDPDTYLPFFYYTKNIYGTAMGESPGAPGDVGDPVRMITGELQADEVDLTLPGPIPLQVRRNYSSQSFAKGDFGFGWKQTYVPYIVPTSSEAKLQVAEMDGSVIIYSRNTANVAEEEWTVLAADNPQLSNGSGMDIGSVRNLFGNRIIRTTPGGIKTYTLYAADGGSRVYEQRSYPVYGTNGALHRTRPYLKRWSDSLGNYLDFHFYGDGAPGDAWYVSNQNSSYGQLARVESSNGNYLGYNYDIYGHIIEAFTGDGRRVGYRYDESGDLVEVTLPDGSWAKYDYLQEQAKVGTTNNLDWYSTHLINRETRPGGRIVESDYQLYVQGDTDEVGVVIPAGSAKIGKASYLRRVVQQRATVGKHAGASDRTQPADESYEPVRNATYTYFNTRSFTTGFTTGRTEILDAYNRKTIYYYVNNRLTKVFDPLSVVTDAAAGTGTNAKMDQTWWTAQDVTNNVPGAWAGALRSMQQRGGSLAEFYYNASGDVTEIRAIGDLDGDGVATDTAITTATYNSNHLPDLVIHPDPVTGAATGKRTQYFYADAARPFMLTRVEQQTSGGAPLNAMQNTYYDVFSNPGVPTEKPLAMGLLQQTKVAQGTADEAVMEWQHDARGFVIKQTGFSDHADQTNYPNVVTEMLHNLRGELVEERVMDGAIAKKTNRYAYDDIGRRIWVERLNEGGQQIAWDYAYYNLTGEVEWTDSSRHNPEDYTYNRYDGAGRPVENVTWRSRAKADGSGVEAIPGNDLYSTTKFNYNLFGDLIKVMDPRGHTVKGIYDDIGRKTSTEAYQGDWQNGGTLLARESVTYDDAQRKVTTTDARGGVTQTFYTSDGRPRLKINPDGTQVEWRYQLDGRLKRQPLSVHTYAEFAYNDSTRTVTKTIKNLLGETLGSEIAVADYRGNVVSATDISGFTATTTYDKLNRVISASVPGSGTSSVAQSSTHYYDATGMRHKVVNALGESKESLSDALGRLLSSVVKDNTNAVVSQSSLSYSADFHSVTSTTGSGGNALTETAYTDISGHTVLVKHIDGSFARTEYDAAGNAIASTDETGQTTKMSYDGLNRVSTTQLPDGATTQFVYTYPVGGGQIVQRQMPQMLTEFTIHDAAGRFAESYLQGVGNAQTRHYQGYQYYAAGKEQGLLQQFTDPRGLVHSFTYDNWLRLATNTVGTSGTPAYVKKEMLDYDVRGMVTQLRETTFTGVSEIVHAYDGQAHLVSEEVRLGADTGSLAPVTKLVNHYDAAGRRDNLGKDGTIASMGDAVGGNWGFTYRADGLLNTVTSAGANFNYTYADNGLLQSRSNPFRNYTVGGRDNRGRLVASTTRLTGQGADVVGEALSWSVDNRQDTYTATRRVEPNNAGNTSTWSDLRSYLYAAQRKQLVSESWVPGAGQTTKTQLHEQDQGQLGGLGVHTGTSVEAPPGSSGNQTWVVNQSGGQDAFSRPINEVSGHEPFGFTAQGAALGAKDVSLNINQDTALLDVKFPEATRFTTGAWNRELWLPAGGYNLLAKANHPSGQFTAQASTSFNVGVHNFAVETGYDGDGNVTDRQIAGGIAANGRTQTMTWDGEGRLIKVVQQEFGGYGYEWTATYDGRNRRVQTLTVPVRNGVAQPGQQVLERSWHDPLVEFLEVGLEVTRGTGTTATKERWWNIHGPDSNGRYGGLEGMGGLEALVKEADGEAVGMIDEAYGHILGFARSASLSAASSGAITFEYHSAQFGGYGALAGTWSPAIAEGVSVWRSFGWHGKRLDITGFYQLGARYYEPVSGRFLSTDPRGHGASMSLYAYANGDPINFVDPTGRDSDYYGMAAAGSSYSGSMTLTPSPSPVTGNQCVYGCHNYAANGTSSGGYRPPDQVPPRIAATIGLAGSAIETVGGTLFAVGSSETGVGIAIGVAIAAHGVDGIQANSRTLWTGEPTPTYTHVGVSNGLQYTGVPEQYADYAATGVELIPAIYSGRGFALMPAAAKNVAAWTSLEDRFSAASGLNRPPVPIYYENLGPRNLAGYNPIDDTITLNSSLSLSPAEELASMRHEYGHMWLNKTSDGLSVNLYRDSLFYPFIEEIGVESYATGSLMKGVLNTMQYSDQTAGAGAWLYHANKALQLGSMAFDLISDPIGKCSSKK